MYKGSSEAEDKTVGQKILRQLLKEEPKKFLDKLQQMEKDHAAVRPPAGGAKKEAAVGGEKLAEDAGAVRMGELVDRLLAEFKEQTGGK